MATRKEKVNAGLFLLIGVLLISATIAVVAGLNLRQPGVPYTIRISKSVGGLREGSVVRYIGVPVGRVTDVDYPKNRRSGASRSRSRSRPPIAPGPTPRSPAISLGDDHRAAGGSDVGRGCR
jgi:hypothetical protein